MQMNRLKNRKILIAVGASLGLVAAVVLAVTVLARPDDEDSPSGGSGELTVQTGLIGDPKLDPGHPLKCFVNGQAVGLLLLPDCARRNGVAPGALDVGLDAQGALGASNGLTSVLTPLPPLDEDPSLTGAAGGNFSEPSAGPDIIAEAPAQPTAAPVSVGRCWRYGDGGWSRLPEEAPLTACVRSLFDGECEPPGGVAYGRWRGRTLRLVAGRVEISADNRVFHLVAPQDADCAISFDTP